VDARRVDNPGTRKPSISRAVEKSSSETSGVTFILILSLLKTVGVKHRPKQKG
jgi:hypothetical protein